MSELEQIIETEVELPPQEPIVDEGVDEVRPDGPGSGRSNIRKELERGFAQERKREQREARTRDRAPQRAVDEYKEGTDVQTEGAEAQQGEVSQNQAGPPEAFSREAKARWAEVPPEVQQAILKREQDSTRGVEELKGRYAELDNTLAPRLDLIRSHGHTPAQAVNQLFQWFDALGADVNRVRQGQGAQAFLALAKSFGLDPQYVFPYPPEVIQYYQQLQAYQQQQQQANQGQQQQDPYAPYFENINARIQQQEQQYAQKIGALESALQAQNQAKTDEMLAMWAKDKPHYENVRHMMARLIASHAVPPLPNGAADLDKAYDMAVHALPEVRQRVWQEQQAKVQQDIQAKQNAETKARSEAASKARKAAASLTPGAPGSDIPQGKRKGSGKSVRESLEEAWRDSGR